MGSASILYASAIKGFHWLCSGIRFSLLCRNGQDTHVIARTHSVSSIEDINGPDEIHTQQQSGGSQWDPTATTQIFLS
jgi:hypothetical protein